MPGIAESQIYFVSDRSGHKEIWTMDYDGANQQQLTHLGSFRSRRVFRPTARGSPSFGSTKVAGTF